MQGVLNHLPQVRLVDNLDGGLSYRKPHANFVMSRRQDQICSKGRGLLSQLPFHKGHTIGMSSTKIHYHSFMFCVFKHDDLCISAYLNQRRLASGNSRNGRSL